MVLSENQKKKKPLQNWRKVRENDNDEESMKSEDTEEEVWLT